MAKNWTFGRILAAGYGLIGLVLLFVAIVGYTSTATTLEKEALVDHAQQVRRNLLKLVAQLTDVETGARGFALVGKDEYLVPYEAGSREARNTLTTLRNLTTENPGHQRQLAELAPLIEKRIADAQQVVEIRRTQGSEASQRLVATETGKELMDRIRAITGSIDAEENSVLQERARNAEESAFWVKAFILWGGLIGVALVALTGWLTIARLKRRIGGAVGLIESSSAELQAAANQQATGAKEQSSAMSEIATTIRELIATSRQIAESAQRVAQVAEDTDTAAQAGEQTVDSANASISGIRRQVDQIVSHMLDLGRKSQQIGSILDIVSELAEQTNILAVNATIEAAGAGEAGKRFGVVADEIRKLSDRVAGSTKEIRVLIDDVRTAVNTTVMATESGSKAVDAGAQEFENVAAAFKQISGMVSTTTDAAKEIELSTKQQTSAVEQVNIATSNVAQATKETEASAAQILQTASELANLSRDLAQLIQAGSRA
ncbi:methyl-accepting chemotaxis protein [Sphingomonas soli]|uniref:methyl-accepting chemotaxis protein n=1 Tax=Sphingomonas soli TaxID=266127 RepID=UPI00082C3BF2|nr:methyl-accepting chemotaxis protein [Sphingomonas soli]